MRKTRFFTVMTGLTALAIVLAVCVLAGCGGGGTPNGNTLTYRGISERGDLYTLIITEVTSRATFIPEEGDTYVLTVGTKKSTGKVSSFNSNSGEFILQPSAAGAEPFTTTVSGGYLAGFEGQIECDDGTIEDDPPSTLEPPPPIIGVVASHDLNVWAGDILANAIKAKGYIADVKVPDRDRMNNQDEQNKLIREVLDGGARVILIGWATGEIKPVMDEVAAKGVDIIAIDRFITGVNSVAYNHYVTVDCLKVGEAQAKAIAEKLDLENKAGPFNIALFAGGDFDSNAKEYYDGAIETLKPYITAGKLNVIGPYAASSDAANFGDVEIDGWNEDTAKTMMEALLKGAAASQTLHAVLAPNDQTAAAIIEALEADTKYKGKTIDNGFPIITGQDFSQKGLIEAGKLYMTIDKGSSQAEPAVELADKLIKGESDASVTGTISGTRNNGAKNIKTYLVNPVVITREDL